MTRHAALLVIVLGLAGCVSGAEAQAQGSGSATQTVTVTRQTMPPRRAGPPPADPEHELSPFNADADAMADTDAALARAAEHHTRALLVLGGNWCHDSRSLAWKLAQPALSPMVEESYELVYVDVGFKNRNLDVAERFGVDAVEVTPTILVLDPDGALLNTDSVSSWGNASSRPIEDVEEYFSRWAKE
jgi:hypothetical protein